MPNKDNNIPQKVLRFTGTPGNEEKSTKEQRISGVKRLVAIGAVALTGLGVAGQIKEANAPDTRPRVAYTVKPGDTLWGIAEKVEPDGDNRKTVYDLQGHVTPIDDKKDDFLQPGDIVDVPADSVLGKQIVASRQGQNDTGNNG